MICLYKQTNKPHATPTEQDTALVPLVSCTIIIQTCIVLFVYASGCPDCVAADPHIERALSTKATAASVVLVECPVVRAEYKGNAGYAYRVHPSLRITEVPTLFRWGKAKPVGKLQGSALEDASGILEVLCE